MQADFEGLFGSALPFWGALEPQEKKQITGSAQMKQFEPGEVMHNGSGDCQGLFVIETGRIRIFLISETGREITLYRLFTGDVCIFTASCILKNITFELFVAAETPTRAAVIPPKVFERLSATSLPVSDFAGKLMASRFSDVMWIVEQVLFMSFDKRLAIFLLDQAGIDGSDTLRITHEEIANHLGSAREVVGRMLKYFAAEGIVKPFRGGIKIIDRKKLAALA